MSQINYVITVAIDPETRTFVAITKNKGPEKLHGRMTYPGGKIEAGEDVAIAGSRELLEEAGIDVPSSAWVIVCRRGDDHFNLTVLAAYTDQVAHARTLESEPISVKEIDSAVIDATQNPEGYVDDFIDIMSRSLRALESRLALKGSCN